MRACIQLLVFEVYAWYEWSVSGVAIVSKTQ